MICDYYLICTRNGNQCNSKPEICPIYKAHQTEAKTKEKPELDVETVNKLAKHALRQY